MLECWDNLGLGKGAKSPLKCSEQMKGLMEAVPTRKYGVTGSSKGQE